VIDACTRTAGYIQSMQTTDQTTDISQWHKECTFYLLLVLCVKRHRVFPASKNIAVVTSKARYTLPMNTARVHGCQKCLLYTRALNRLEH